MKKQDALPIGDIISMYVHNRTLYVRLSSAVLRNELTMLRNELLTRINAEFGHRVIDNIIFR